MFSMVFAITFMESIGFTEGFQIVHNYGLRVWRLEHTKVEHGGFTDTFHKFLCFGLSQPSGHSSRIHGNFGNHWFYQCLPWFLLPISWKTVALHMFSMTCRILASHSLQAIVSDRSHGNFETHWFYQCFPCFLATNFTGNIHVFVEELCTNIGFLVFLKRMPQTHMSNQ